MQLVNFLNIVFKYEVISWYTSHSAGAQVQSSCDNSRVIEKVVENSSNVLQRVNDLSMDKEEALKTSRSSKKENESDGDILKHIRAVKVSSSEEVQGGCLASVGKVSSLIAEAIDPDNLCQMDPTWQAWL